MLRPDVHPQASQRLFKDRYVRLKVGIARSATQKYANPSDAFGLLRVRGDGQYRRAADKRDELSPPHSITSSASASRSRGILRPSAVAVLLLITSSNLV